MFGTGRSSLLALALLASATAGGRGRVVLEVDVAPPAAAAGPIPVELRLSQAGGTGTTPGELRNLALEAPGRVVTELPPGSVWRLAPRAEGFWGEETLLAVGPDGAAAGRGLLYPTGVLRFALDLPRGTPPPTSLTAEVSPAADPTAARPGEGPSGSIACAMAAGEVRCPLPAGRLDVELRAPGFASELRWGVVVPAGKRRDLGRIALQPGASVVGTVEVEEGSPTAVEVELAAATAAPPGEGTARRLRKLSARTRPDEHGFFQFRDVAEGSYRLVARGEGLSPASLEPIRVFAGHESQLQAPLHLRPPVGLTVAVLPPADPAGRPWRLALYPRESADGSAPEAVQGLIGADGSWSSAGRTPGRYDLEIVDAAGGHWHAEEVDLEAGMPPLVIELPLVAVRGEVTLDGKGVRARLDFGLVGSELHVVLTSDLEGRYAGALPRPGEWPLRVALHRGGPFAVLDPVTVERDPSGKPTLLDIVVPNTTVPGRVTDRGGRPVRGATVLVRDRALESHEPSEATTDEEGRFELRGLPPGAYRAQAELRDPRSPTGVGGTSGAAELEVPKEGAAAEVHLVLGGQRTLHGVVVSPRGPVAGALVHLRPEMKDPARSAVVPEVVTGTDGTFDVPLPDDVDAAALVVVASGFATRIVRLELAPDDHPTLPLEELAGSLSLDLSTTARGGAAWMTRPPTVFHRGAWVSLTELLAAAETSGERRSHWALPAMEPGDDRLCWGFVAPCVGGDLLPGGDLALTLPEHDGPASGDREDGQRR